MPASPILCCCYCCCLWEIDGSKRARPAKQPLCRLQNAHILQFVCVCVCVSVCAVASFCAASWRANNAPKLARTKSAIAQNSTILWPCATKIWTSTRVKFLCSFHQRGTRDFVCVCNWVGDSVIQVVGDRLVCWLLRHLKLARQLRVIPASQSHWTSLPAWLCVCVCLCVWWEEKRSHNAT